MLVPFGRGLIYSDVHRMTEIWNGGLSASKLFAASLELSQILSPGIIRIVMRIVVIVIEQ